MLLVCAVAASGCSLIRLHRDNREFDAATALAGRVLPGDWNGPVSVAAVAQRDGKPTVVQEVWLHEPGGFELLVKDGSYTLVAYGDRDNDGRPDPGAPAGVWPHPVQVAAAGLISRLDIPLSGNATPDLGRVLPVHYRRAARASSAAGALADLDAPQFSAAAGKRGYWAPLETFRSNGGNVYFIGPYDAARIPVLFVHGATGSAQDWRYFIAHLDSTRFQPWLFQYPSGAPLASSSHLLYWKLLDLQLRYRFTRLDIVAHSMGGLLTRRFLMDHAAEFPQLGQFISISTPWGGQPMAAEGVNRSPAVIPSWRDIQPAGLFLQSLFAAPLPAGITHSLLFGHQGGDDVLASASDGTISVASQLRPEARAGAALVMGFEETHAGILSSPKVVSEVERILAAAEARGGGDGGRLSIGLSPGGGGAPAIGNATIVMRRLEGQPPRPTGRLLFAVAPVAGRADIGPLEPGDYEVRFSATGFRAVPDRQRIRIATGGQANVNFRLDPEGVLMGEVLRESGLRGRPAGSFQRAGDALHVGSIRLDGPGGVRELVPRRETESSVLDAYLDGHDHASNHLFCFVGLPPGQYVLTVSARGFETNASRYSVVPGQPVPVPPIVMRKIDRAAR